jgi:uncharacterized C2H2 Zn-finger protein
MSLIIENITNNININNDILSVKEILKLVNYEFNELYIDRFWSNITDDKWLYIDNEMLLWIGYSDIDLPSAKRTYSLILKDNFEEIKDYKSLNSREFNIISKCVLAHLENYDFNLHNKTKHLLVSPDCFKQSLMLLKTNKSKEIRKYYTELEKIFKFYLQYQSKYQELKNLKINKELEETKINLENKENEFKRFIINQSNKVIKLEKEEYVYGSTNHLNALSNITKFGKSKNVNSRLCNFNINALDDNEFYHFLIKKVYDSSTLESLIHSLLKPFNYKNELFQLHSTPLLKIVNKICYEYDKLTDLVNDYIENEFQDDLNLEVKIPKPLTGEEIKNIKNDIYIENESDDEEKETDINIDRMAIEDNIHIYKGIKLYNCPRCNIFTCKERNTMLNHISRSTKCEENKNENINIEELIKKNNIKFYPCEKCNKITFSTPAKLRRHQYSLTPCTESFRCEPCNLDFRIEVDLNAHKNRINCLGNKNNKEETKNKEVNIQNIPKVNIINGMEFYKCNLCELLFKSKQNLNSHLNRKIKCNELHVCRLCNKKFHSVENLRKHEKNSTECDKNIFKCGNCNKTFMSNKSLKNHIKLNNCIKDKH